MSKFKEIVKSEKITLEKFRMLHNEFQLMHNDGFIKHNETQCEKVIELTIDYLLYGEANNSLFFE